MDKRAKRKAEPMRFYVAMLLENDKVAQVIQRYCSTENRAARFALTASRDYKTDMCVVERTKKGEQVVQRIRYYGQGVTV